MLGPAGPEDGCVPIAVRAADTTEFLTRRKGRGATEVHGGRTNALRAKRITGYVDETFTNAQDLLSAVIEERFKELCFEGFRFFDLKRLGMPMQRNASDVDSPNWQSLSAGNFRFVFPIPQSEILANPNMAPNPGYN